MDKDQFKGIQSIIHESMIIENPDIKELQTPNPNMKLILYHEAEYLLKPQGQGLYQVYSEAIHLETLYYLQQGE